LIEENSIFKLYFLSKNRPRTNEYKAISGVGERAYIEPLVLLPHNLLQNHPGQSDAIRYHRCDPWRRSANVIPCQADGGNDRSRDA